jgi:hypothetical protein
LLWHNYCVFSMIAARSPRCILKINSDVMARNDRRTQFETQTVAQGLDNGTVDQNTQRASEKRFELVVDSVPYSVKATPFTFNAELRYYISLNGGPDHVFVWDPEIRSLRAIDEGTETWPDALEEAISQKLL